MAQAVKHLPKKYEALSLKLSTTNKTKQKYLSKEVI
jgi:hypothetical protein